MNHVLKIIAAPIGRSTPLEMGSSNQLPTDWRHPMRFIPSSSLSKKSTEAFEFVTPELNFALAFRTTPIRGYLSGVQDLAYGYYRLRGGGEVVFNRRYRPVMARERRSDGTYTSFTLVDPSTWI